MFAVFLWYLENERLVKYNGKVQIKTTKNQDEGPHCPITFSAWLGYPLCTKLSGKWVPPDGLLG